jgi:virulence-associated protein VapD
MAEVLQKCGIKRQSGYLYFIDKKGNAARVQMARKGKKTSTKQEVLCKCGLKREKGYLYFVDKNGNAARAKMARGGKKKRK